MHWEPVESENGTHLCNRLELPHGWLIRMNYSDGGHTCFIPKANREGW
jgi:hypothetical protein